MGEDIVLNNSLNKSAKYQSFIKQLDNLIAGEMDSIANIGNILSAIKYGFGHLWVGIYLIDDDQLVLNLFQGPIACTRITKGKGVCGQSWQKNEVIVVPDVDQFVGHISCSSASRSEIVLPLHDTFGQVIGVLDIDSEALNSFDSIDEEYLTIIAKLIEIEYAK